MIRQSDFDRSLEAGSAVTGGTQFAGIVVEDGKDGPKYRRVVGPFRHETPPPRGPRLRVWTAMARLGA